MRVALLHNVNRGQNEHEAEFDSPYTIDAVQKALATRHEVELVEATRDISSWVARLNATRPDLVFNVAEGFHGAARESVFPAILEELELDYSGPGPTELLVLHNKQLTKGLLRNEGVPMPWGKLLRSARDLEVLRSTPIPFPLIVKLNSEGSSMGMDEHCIVADWAAFETQVRKVDAKYRRNILAEQYIPGRDVSCSFIEGMGSFGPVEYRYLKGEIYDFELKTASNHTVDVVKPEDIPAELCDQMKAYSGQIAEALDINGYGRADFRLTPDGQLYFLEMNGQVSFHTDGAFVLAAQHAGHSFDEVVLHIAEHSKNTVRRTSAMGR